MEILFSTKHVVPPSGGIFNHEDHDDHEVWKFVSTESETCPVWNISNKNPSCPS
jgi:hypothetical protein